MQDYTQNTPIKSNQKKNKIIKSYKLPKHLEHLNQMAAGIDIGSKSHFVAVPEECGEPSVREFKSFTADLHELANWLEKCGIVTIVMESTGVYWIPLFDLLEERGFEVKLVDARHVKNVSGRKTDVLDCQWLQQLHTYGLLNGAFRPAEEICRLRAYLRQRSMLIIHMGTCIQHMQKAMSQMNLQLHNVLNDVMGVTGMLIIRAIIDGQRDPKVLASYRDHRCKNSLDIIEKSLEGYYREEHIFSLTQAVELYDVYKTKVDACDEEIEKQLMKFKKRTELTEEEIEAHVKKKRLKRNKNAPTFNLKAHLIRTTGVDLTEIPGVEAFSALKIVSEIGLDMSRWKTSKHFASWLGLCPGNKVSGGKRLSGKTKRSANPAAVTLRMLSSTLDRSQTALGAYLRRMKSRLGPAKAISATAHKIAIIFYNMLKHGVAYFETGQDYYEERYHERLVKSLQNRAKILGFALIEINEKSTS